MNNIKIEASERSPELEFNFAASEFLIKGESYPEDVTEFYDEPMSAFESYVAKMDAGNIKFTFELIYFNSSSAKVLMGLFDMLDAAAGRGVSVEIFWRYETDDDNMEELGEEFGEDLENAKFTMIPIEV